MFEIIRYSSAREKEWNAFVSKSKNATFLFDRSYMDYHSDRFCDSSLMFYQNGKLYAVMPANIDGKTLYSHQGLSYGGLLMTEKCTAAGVLALFTELCEWLKADGIEKVIYKAIPSIYCKCPSEEDLYALFRNGATLVARGISSTISLACQLKWRQNRRTALNKAKETGISVAESNDIRGFWNILESNLRQNHNVAPVHSADEMILLKNRFPDNIKLMAAFDKSGKMVGGILLYVTKHVTHSQYISASEEGKRDGAIDAIMDDILHRDDTPYFDFGISTEQGGRFLNESLIFQKEGFGGRGVCYDIYEMNV